MRFKTMLYGRPLGRCNEIINEKNYDYIYIILYSICFMFTKTNSI